MLGHFEKLFSQKISKVASTEDPAHDLLHFQRVVVNAKKIAQLEKANLAVVIPAAWLHDLVILPKSSPLRSQASKLSAQKALEYLAEIQYPNEYHQAISHAIEAHSFSAQIETTTLEAQVVQDADRLDALGAIGIARCFAVAGQLQRSFYHAEDSFCNERAPEDAIYTIDHFYKKLLLLGDSMKTQAGRVEAQARIQFMQLYLQQFKNELRS